MATLEPGKNGLYDMVGNVAEWTWEPYDKFGINLDPAVQRMLEKRVAGAAERVVRGGSWGTGVGSARLANREKVHPSTKSYLIGLRLARSL